MTVPDFQSMMRPVLELHADGLPHASADVRDNVAQVLGVTQEDRQVPLPGGRTTRYANRIAWAVTHMAQALLLERPQRGSPRSPRGAEMSWRSIPTGSTWACWHSSPSTLSSGAAAAASRAKSRAAGRLQRCHPSICLPTRPSLR
jgi:hypothetical protein